MKSFALLAAVAVLIFTVSGCVGTATPIVGSLVTANLKSGVTMGDNTAGTSNVGTAMATGIIGFVSGDCSISAAMANGSGGAITKVHHVDSEVFNVLGIYATYKTVVYGE